MERRCERLRKGLDKVKGSNIYHAEKKKPRNGQGADGKENTSALLLLKPKRLTCNEAGWRYEKG